MIYYPLFLVVDGSKEVSYAPEPYDRRSMKFMLRLSVKLVVSLWVISSLGFFENNAWAGNKRIWQQPNNPANYVGLSSAKESQIGDAVLNHPYTFDPKKLTDMFLSLRYNKKMLLRKGIQDKQLFFDAELVENKFIPKIVEAFEEAGPDQVVVISIVQKDPYFIIRNDRLNVIQAYVAQDGLHLNFTKSDAKLFGDYQAQKTGFSLREGAVSLGVTLEPQPGQSLSFTNPNEIILDTNYNFARLVDQKADEDSAKKMEEERAKKYGKRRSPESSPTSSSVPTPVSNTPAPTTPRRSVAETPTTPVANVQSTEQRLNNLKVLKEKGLINQQEYDAKRKEILKDL